MGVVMLAMLFPCCRWVSQCVLLRQSRVTRIRPSVQFMYAQLSYNSNEVSSPKFNRRNNSRVRFGRQDSSGSDDSTKFGHQDKFNQSSKFGRRDKFKDDRGDTSIVKSTKFSRRDNSKHNLDYSTKFSRPQGRVNSNEVKFDRGDESNEIKSVNKFDHGDRSNEVDSTKFGHQDKFDQSSKFGRQDKFKDDRGDTFRVKSTKFSRRDNSKHNLDYSTKFSHPQGRVNSNEVKFDRGDKSNEVKSVNKFDRGDRSNEVDSTKFGRLDIWKIRRERFMKKILGLVKKKKIEEANELFSSMISDHKVRPTTALYNAVIKGHAESGDVISCFRFFNDLKKRGLTPSDHTYSTMFGACARVGPEALDTLNKIMAEIERREVSLNTQSFNAQLSALVHCGKIDKAFELFSEPSARAPQSSIETFGTLLLAAAKDRTDGMRRGIVIWNELTKHFVPNLHCYNTLLLCLRDAGISDDMIQSSTHVASLSDINGNNFENISISANQETSFKLSEKDGKDFNLRVFIYRGHVRFIGSESLSNFIQSMNTNDIRADIRTISILSSIVPNFSEVLALSKSLDIKLDDQVVKSASQFRKASGDKRKTKALLLSNDNTSSITKEPSLNDLARRCKDSHGILNLLKKMKDSNSYNDISLWKSLVDVCIRQRNYITLLHMLKEMRNNEVIVSPEILEALDNTVMKPPKNQWLMTSFNGFKGYYTIWSKSFGKEMY